MQRLKLSRLESPSDETQQETFLHFPPRLCYTIFSKWRVSCCGARQWNLPLHQHPLKTWTIPSLLHISHWHGNHFAKFISVLPFQAYAILDNLSILNWGGFLKSCLILCHSNPFWTFAVMFLEAEGPHFKNIPIPFIHRQLCVTGSLGKKYQ